MTQKNYNNMPIIFFFYLFIRFQYNNIIIYVINYFVNNGTIIM